MINAKKKVEKFLKDFDMDYANIDLEKNCNMFLEEMEKGLNSSDSSLKMIPTYLSMDKEVPVNEPVIVIDAGGTNFRVCVVHFDNNRKPVIEDFNVYPMPGTKGEISREEFFNTIAKYLEPVINKSNKIGFCFSYPTEIFPNKDGRLIFFSKEVRVRDVEGEIIGENVLKAIGDLGYDNKKNIVLLNDTVATLLGGKASFPDRVFESYIGFILGTGTNICYIEKSSSIGKVPDLKSSEGSMLINVESGNYNKVPRGKIDIEFDNTTKNPGEFILEKTISGAYQGGLILTVIKKAVESGLFTDAFKEKVSSVKELTSKEIDDFLYFPYADNTLAVCCSGAGNDDDRFVLYCLIDAVMERAAKFVAFSLTASIIKSGKGNNPCAPVCITADGSTFYKSKLFRGKLDHYIKTFTNEQKNLYCEFVKAENGNLIGTAIAGLLN
ncbi:MAG: hexokinase [Clostridia bacterium]|nr:hexokinase [Clostridia bacterium]